MTASTKFLLWRGSLGGFIGGLLGIIILVVIYAEVYHNKRAALHILQLPLYWLVTIPTGIIIAAIVWQIEGWSGRKVWLIVRVIIGMCVAGAVGAFWDYKLLTPLTESIWGRFFTKYGLIVGAIAGIIARPRKRAQSDEPPP